MARFMCALPSLAARYHVTSQHACHPSLARGPASRMSGQPAKALQIQCDGTGNGHRGPAVIERRIPNGYAGLGKDCRSGKNIAGWKWQERRDKQERWNAQDERDGYILRDPQFGVRSSGNLELRTVPLRPSGRAQRTGTSIACVTEGAL